MSNIRFLASMSCMAVALVLTVFSTVLAFRESFPETFACLAAACACWWIGNQVDRG